tara:strand:- start:384 stop:839 length:456 start_codon:yes stop_codon:yes gene_type:complete
MRDYIDTDYLILVSSDGRKTGLEIFRDRIKKNRWPIYDKTPQLLNVKVGKNVIFYIAGTGENKQSFVGTARIKKRIYSESNMLDPNQEFRKVIFFIEFENLKLFDKSINIKDHIEKLDFIKNKEKYGLYFQGGVCKIDEVSHNYIIDCSNR